MDPAAKQAHEVDLSMAVCPVVQGGFPGSGSGWVGYFAGGGAFHQGLGWTASLGFDLESEGKIGPEEAAVVDCCWVRPAQESGKKVPLGARQAERIQRSLLERYRSGCRSSL